LHLPRQDLSMQLRYVEQALFDGARRCGERPEVRSRSREPAGHKHGVRVELLTSELATNALLHGRSAFDIVVLEAGGRLRVEVADDCPKNAVLVTADQAAVHGRGIFIVNELADSWGSTENGAGKTVWFELAITGCQEPLPTPR